MNLKQGVQTMKHIVNCIYLIGLMFILSPYVYAFENNINQQTISIGGLKSEPLLLNSQSPMTTAEQGKSKAEMQESINKKILTNNNKSAKTSSLTHSDFGIYSANSFLDVDQDLDGYYQTFSVLFDADFYGYHETTGQQVSVYALLYMSKNGEPWSHFFTTDNFIIAGDSELDEYEVITTLVSGYPPGEYDILIDLYQVGYSNIVASFSADDSNALYALPLESGDFDNYYVEEVDVIGGGVSSILGLFTLFSLFLFRFFQKNWQTFNVSQ